MAKRVIDLLEVIEVNVEERQLALMRGRVSLVGEEGVEEVEQLTAVAKPCQFVGDRLPVAFLGERPQAPHRQRQPDADDYQRRRGEPQGDAIHGPQLVDKEKRKSCRSAQTGDKKARWRCSCHR